MSVRGQRGRGMGGHQQAEGDTAEWYTPPGIIGALGLEYDLDPCSPPGGVPWIPTSRCYALEDDGLTQPWAGRVWLNPPYGPHTGQWMRRLAAHGSGIALVFARTETRWWHEVVPAASAVCFIAGRLTFVQADGQASKFNSGAPSALVAFGETETHAVTQSGLGMVILNSEPALPGQRTIWEML